MQDKRPALYTVLDDCEKSLARRMAQPPKSRKQRKTKREVIERLSLLRDELSAKIATLK